MLRAATALIASMAAASAIAAPASAPAGPSACAASPRRVGACFVVHGRLAVWNGAPAVRIWRIGTKRMLGVVGADGDPASAHLTPPSVDRARTTDFTAVDGDYRVCPLSIARPGHMQIVCMDGAANLVAREPRALKP
ncbi:MAG TPA: hypothetical protein VHZ26_13160 [Caulobacteraceae bacterium]|jgi:hypothetical protein|nr:hypothetical protein [Caulobacteraceae bacterium]